MDYHQGSSVRTDKVSRSVEGFAVVVISLFALLSLIPFVMMISASFSTETIISVEGISLWPRGFTTAAYDIMFKSPRFLVGSYIVTIIMTVCGTGLGLLLIAMTGYVLSRRDYFLRNKISFFIYFTTLFSAGLAPTYLWMVRYLNLKNNYMAVFLPLLMTPWLIMLMKNFMKSIPYEITESGKIDGAGDFQIFAQLILPSMTPALATVGLFLALNYWNEWYNTMLYLPNKDYQPLQYYLYKTVNMAASLKQSMAGANVPVGSLPTTTLKMATAVLATGPIILLYPFVQRYFIAGITVGAVKG